MKIYNYNKDTKVFTTSTNATENPLEKGKYLIPANATEEEPLPSKDGFAVCFNEIKKEWEYQEDNRGKTVYSTSTKQEVNINYLGSIKSEHTLSKPKEFDKWNGTKWETDIDKLKENKTLSINIICKESIISGFKSSAKGIKYAYESDEIDQLNLIGAATTGVSQNIKCSSDDGLTWQWINHLSSEIKQVLKDGAISKATYLEKAALLKDQISKSITIEQLEQIKW